MIASSEIVVLQAQLARMYTAIASLKEEVLSKSQASFDIMSEGPLAEIRQLRARLDALTGVTEAEENEPALWLRIEGKDVHWPEAPTSVLTALLDALRKGVQAGTEYIVRGALGTRPTSAIRSACDFRIIGLQTGSLRVGVRLPECDELESGDAELSRQASQALQGYVQVATWAASDEDSDELEDAVPDPQLRRLLLTQVKNLAPRPRGTVSRVSLEGRIIGAAKRISLDRDVHGRIDTAIELTAGSDEITDYRGDVREIDLDALQFNLRNIEGDEEKNLTCHFDVSLIDTATEALGRSVEVKAVVRKVSGVRGGRVTVLGLVIVDEPNRDSDGPS